jgi:hypothetical protein
VAKMYIVYNGPMCTTSPPAKVTTGTSTKTMLQVAPNMPVKPVAWGVSFDGTTAAVPGVCELIETGTVFATVTAYAVADVQLYGDPNTANANTSGTSGMPLRLGTALSGYTSTSEGTTTASRMADPQLVAPTNQYSQQWPLGREFEVASGACLRIRMTFGTAVNALCWVLLEV